MDQFKNLPYDDQPTLYDISNPDTNIMNYAADNYIIYTASEIATLSNNTATISIVDNAWQEKMRLTSEY